VKFANRRSFTHLNQVEKGSYRIYLGLLVGVFTAGTTYAFLVCIREAIRILGTVAPEYFWYFSAEELYFSSYVLAFFALQLGQMQCFKIWWQRHYRSRQMRYTQSLIFHDFRTNFWYFFYWFFALSFYYSFYMIDGGFHHLKIIVEFSWLWVLLLLVLHLNSFATYRRLAKAKFWKPFALSSVLVFGLAALLAFWQPAGAEKMQAINAEKDIFKKNNFQLPVSPLRNKVNLRFGDLVNVYYGDNGKIQYRYRNTLFTEKDTLAKKLNTVYETPFSSFPKLTLRADSRIPMAHLAFLLGALEPNVYSNFYVGIASVNRKLPPALDMRFQRVSASALLAAWRDTAENSPVASNLAFSFTNYVPSAVSAKERLAELTSILYRKMDQAPNYPYLELEIDATTTLGDYILAKSAFYLAVKQKRQDYAQNLFTKNFEKLKEEEKKTCEQLYPVRLKLTALVD
jgi:hypothetical protein